jgi:hypothetical protein
MIKIVMLWLLLGLFRRSFRSRRDLLLENLALRQQLLVLKRRNTKPRLNRVDRLFWIVAKRLWSRWQGALVIVTHETTAPRDQSMDDRSNCRSPSAARTRS